MALTMEEVMEHKCEHFTNRWSGGVLLAVCDECGEEHYDKDLPDSVDRRILESNQVDRTDPGYWLDNF